MSSGTPVQDDDAIGKIFASDQRAAVIVIDMQNDFCAPGGTYAQSGLDITPLREIVGPIARVVRAARQTDMPVLYLQQTTLPGGRSDSPAWSLFKTRGGRRGDYTLADTWGQQIVEELAPGPEDLVIQKFRSSGFAGTPFEVFLGARGIRTLIVGGCETDGCVASTVRDAQVRDYVVVLVEDCLASVDRELHRCALTVLRSRFPAVTSKQLLSYWERRAVGA